MSTRLMKGNVTEVSTTECNRNYTAAFKGQSIPGYPEGINQSLICAKDLKKQANACKGNHYSAIKCHFFIRNDFKVTPVRACTVNSATLKIRDSSLALFLLGSTVSPSFQAFTQKFSHISIGLKESCGLRLRNDYRKNINKDVSLEMFLKFMNT